MKPINFARIAVFFCLFTRMAAASIMYGVGPFEVGVHSNLYRIDTNTGAATLIGDTGFERLSGLAFHPNGTLYGYTPGALYTINTATGAATRVGLLGMNSPEGGLAFDPTTATLFAVSSTLSDTLLTIDINTGAATTVGPLGSAGRDTSGLAFSASGVLYGAAYRDGNADQLITINTAIGAATLVGPLGTNVPTPTVGGLEFDPVTGILYYSDNTRLYSVNAVTGAASLIGAHGAGVPIGGLAAVVPEPAAVTLILIGLTAARRRRF